MILIGSKAMKHHVPDARIGADWDLITSREEYAKFQAINGDKITKIYAQDEDKHHIYIGKEHFEFEIDYWLLNESESSADFKSINQWGVDIKIANPTLLFVLKKSHIHAPIGWWKHINDYHTLKPLVDQIEYKKYKKFLQDRIDETNWRLKSRAETAQLLGKVNLNVSNEEFFEKSQGTVNRQFPHDSLHEATCYGKVPIYDTLKIDHSAAKLERHLWDKLSHEDQIRCVREEGYAIALERRIIPAIASKKKFYPRAAFVIAIEKICTTLTTGWFREFAIDNAIEIMNYDVDYVGKWIKHRIANTDDESVKTLLKEMANG